MLAIKHIEVALLMGWRMAILAATAACTATAVNAADGVEFSGSVGVELRLFSSEPAYAGQLENAQLSTILSAEAEWESEDRVHQIYIEPWLRLDAEDDERTHFDVREAYYRWIGDAWDVRLGVGKVFWGVSESRHLVDVINQTDGVEDVDGEDKLGQPMLEISTLRSFGELTLYVLPYFRERTFAGPKGRLRPPIFVDTDAAVYESADEERRVDVALRYSQYFGAWDVGISAFHGTSREPRLVPTISADRLIPHYDIITQVGADIQYTHEAWLWKFEGLVREGHADTFFAAVGGFEYTFYGITTQGADLGVLVEYQYDGRDDDPLLAPGTIAEEDLFLGARFALNDAHDAQLLGGSVIDISTGAMAASIEVERRFGQNWFAEIEARLFLNTGDDALSAFDDDDVFTARLTRYF